ncbi:hypothetical protein TTMY_2139 [Thermus thermophilus]|uniref:hypothetical protein n=1 Tax=Thermus thermophilus TaxID=274 RepID=UPI00090A47E8|nr:hypothetical protein [Thermus thermophilus]BAW02505.1 hypothetical protein TTMY_2139 [Thermus thermophilus]BDB10740.1 hypothetical protein TthTMY_04790 [Thermus thermophilus]
MALQRVEARRGRGREAPRPLPQKPLPGRFPPLYLMDTTGLAYRSKDRLLRFRRGKEVRRVREGWDLEVYRFRGVVEGVFGGMKTRLGGGYLLERKPWTAMARALLELIAYGLRVLLSLLPPPPGYKAIY